MKLFAALEAVFDSGSIHGLSHITNRSKHPAERCFWLLVCLFAWLMTYATMKANWDRYEHNAVSFLLETDYIRWNSPFPAFSICEKDTQSKISEAAKEIYGPDRNLNIEIFVRDIAFFDGTCGTCRDKCRYLLNCTGDLEYIAKTTRKTCQDLIHDCEWLGQPFDCCSEFLPLQTEHGPCFSINSANTERLNNSVAPLDFIVNRTTGPGKLTFMTDGDVYLFRHSPEDVPMINHPPWERATINSGSEFKWSFYVREIVNDAELIMLRLEQRKCRFPDENNLQSYRAYSYSGCLVESRSKKQLQLCGCIDHFRPKINGAKSCDSDGLSCLTEYSDELRNARYECLDSCVEPEYDTVFKKNWFRPRAGGEKPMVKIHLELADLPNLRFRRIVVRTMLDLVVGMGGAFGLFLGASLLSTLEILFSFHVSRAVVVLFVVGSVRVILWDGFLVGQMIVAFKTVSSARCMSVENDL
ncbi:Amiloride-sensitive sodium channel [Nesidiocoris tenuis]|uniref:Amiloride-sensitive sodium channel n=1 Tax=Nesidiocoris tenuis TaxID=355587 RepID=A0ABN7AYA8_9HEMI|nr:Amiloride-sensitive sodium channel [Nesidiocoris tenuis]